MTAARLTAVATATACVPATCGELLQGVDDDGPLLVSLPVALLGTVRVTLVREPAVVVTPDLPRARCALELALERAGWQGGAVATLGGEVPRGRGLGSSTVDVAGVIGAAMAAAGVALEPIELVRLMTAVEPSDSSPLPGLWAIDHVQGRRAVRLGDVPAHWRLVAVDSGGPVDTVAVHRMLGPGPRVPGGMLLRLLHADAAGLARVAGESARRNQERLPHPAFAEVERVARAVGAEGLCVAHSGSLCALTCSDDAQAGEAARALDAVGLASVTWRTAAPGLRVSVDAVLASTPCL